MTAESKYAIGAKILIYYDPKCAMKAKKASTIILKDRDTGMPKDIIYNRVFICGTTERGRLRPKSFKSDVRDALINNFVDYEYNGKMHKVLECYDKGESENNETMVS